MGVIKLKIGNIIPQIHPKLRPVYGEDGKLWAWIDEYKLFWGSPDAYDSQVAAGERWQREWEREVFFGKNIKPDIMNLPIEILIQDYENRNLIKY